MPISDRYTEKADEPVSESDRRILERDGITLEADETYGDALVKQNLLKGIRGDVAAAKEIREAIEGKAGQRIEPRDAVEQKIELVAVYDHAPIKNTRFLKPEIRKKLEESEGKVEGAAEGTSPPKT